MTDNIEKPGHLARRFQQIAVAVFHAEVEAAGYDLTPVQYAALTTVGMQPGIDQATLAGLIAYDRTTITGVVDRLAQKGLLVRQASRTDRRAHALRITNEGRRTLERDRAGRRGRAADDIAWPVQSRSRNADAAPAQGHRRGQRTKPRPAASGCGYRHPKIATRSDPSRYSPFALPLPFSVSSPMCSTDTTCSSSAVSNTMTPWVERPATRMPSTGQRIS